MDSQNQTTNDIVRKLQLDSADGRQRIAKAGIRTFGLEQDAKFHFRKEGKDWVGRVPRHEKLVFTFKTLMYHDGKHNFETLNDKPHMGCIRVILYDGKSAVFGLLERENQNLYTNRPGRIYVDLTLYLSASFGQQDNAMQHLRRAEDLLRFGATRKKKTYMLPKKPAIRTHSTGYYYLTYKKEEVLMRIQRIHDDLPVYNEYLPVLLIFMLGSVNNTFDSNFVEFRASNMLLCFHLACVCYFTHNYENTTDKYESGLIDRSLEVFKTLKLTWFLKFCEQERENLTVISDSKGKLASKWFNDIAFFFHNKYTDKMSNPEWHHDGKANTRSVVYSACHPQPVSGCGTRICYDIPRNDGFTYPSAASDKNALFTEKERHFLESRCQKLPSEQLMSINVSRSSNSLHRGLNKDELKGTTRVFLAFDEMNERAFDIVFSKMNDVRTTHGGDLLDFAEISIDIHAELDSLANDLLKYFKSIEEL